ncbi:glycosyltransferase family 2 protein [Brevibacillus humidisoli]|uniref:glycosyltransferase family 2 protein n=1 Tax=Brevibacillus humidisoli TaxID=2895522 RepID=UPI001E5326AB|nr:glycosyltransferase family 2 protein [Brevibacillus humidisoli]UFJ42457.1 glycosyltransferase family 2 protein [Brevibacillus humidisoli]
MRVVLPMAGLGRRLQQEGDVTPKMLRQIAGRPMLHWALDSLQGQVDVDHVIFVCLKQHLDRFPLEQTIRRYSRDARIIALDHPTRGQAETVLAAAPHVPLDQPLMIYNCDTYLESRIGQTLARLSGLVDGVISVFPSQEDCFSYVEVDDTGTVTRTTEKEVVSSYASTGLYHFSRARFFWEAAETAIAQGERTAEEYYVAPLYNDLIAQGKHFVIDQADCCYPLGTPEQLEAFLPYAAALSTQQRGSGKDERRGWRKR